MAVPTDGRLKLVDEMAIKQRLAPDADRNILMRLAAGDERALAELYDQHGATAYSLAYAIVGNAADAEEVVADAFAQVWRTAGGFDAGRGSAAAWVHMITRTRALDLLRSRRRRSQAMDRAASQNDEGIALPLGAGEAADQALERQEIGQRVRDSLAVLPEAQRRVIELAYFGGLSQSEIAERLREPLGTIKTRTRAAMEKLRQVLAPLRSEVGQ